MSLEKAGPFPTPTASEEIGMCLPVPENLDQLMQTQTNVVTRPIPVETETASIYLSEADLPVPKPLDQLMREGVSAVSGPLPMETKSAGVSLAEEYLPAP
jgi:hypothetical protein